MKQIKLINSIQIKLIVVLIGVILFIFCFSLSLNHVFLPTYYEKTKKDLVMDVYYQILTDKDINLFKISSDNNLTIYKLKVSNDSNSLLLEYPLILSDEDFNRIDSTIREYYISDKKDIISIIKKTNTYIVCKMYDNNINSNYLDLFSRIDDDIIYIRCNLENIQKTINVSSEFLFYIILLAIIEGCLIMIIVSNRFTKPILNLSYIALEMSKLNFTKKYNEKRNDEIGVLGESINKLSYELKSSIESLQKVNAELEIQLEEKEEIDNMRKSFISDISHEFKTPISIIQGYAEGLKFAITDEDNKDFYCDVIIEEIEKMNILVQKLLQLNKLEFGYSEINLTKINIKDYIETKIRTMSLLFKQNNIKVDLDLLDENVFMDEFLLEEILNNFLSNAIHHANNSKEIKITIKDELEIIKISIFNTGLNIPIDELDKIWVKFYKVDKARTREFGGNGLGLSIIKAILTSLNLEYGCNNLNDGVEFWFTLKKI